MLVKRSVLFAGVALAVAGLASISFAQDAAKVIEQRQAMMKVFGGNMKALSEVAKGEKQATNEEIGKRARDINATAKQISLMFKPEFHVGNVGADMKTTASDKIWKEPEQFTGAANKLELASVDLAAAADAGDQEKIKAAIGAMGKTCGGCHEVYRIKK